MYSDEMTGNGSPVEGKGGEMVPGRGLPFEAGEETAYGLGGEPRTVTPEELAELLGTSRPRGAAEGEMENDRGLGAAHPILTDEDLAGEVGSAAVEIPAPPAGARRGMPVFDSAAGLSGAQGRESTAHLEASEAMMDLLITEERLVSLWNRIDQCQHDIRTKVPSLAIARQLADQVERARNELLAGRSRYEEAERAVNEVELRIVAVERSLKDTRFAYWLLIYELLWSDFLALTLVGLSLLSTATAGDILYAGLSAAWGGLGGIIGALHALWRHVSRDVDFSRQYGSWYITNPILGVFLGAVIFIVMRAGLISLDVGATTESLGTPYVIYVLAAIVGFQQNVAYDLLRRVIQVFSPTSGENGAPATESSGQGRG